MINTFTYSPDEIAVSEKEIARLVGFPDGIPDDSYNIIIPQQIKKAKSLCKVQGGYHVFGNIELLSENKQIIVNQTTFDIGEIIFAHLRKSEQVVLFTCTIGSEISDYATELIRKGDVPEGYVTDLVASELVEGALENFHTSLEQNMGRINLGVTNRFSPGYCGWDVSQQHLLFSLFPNNFCGISLNENSLMYPIKSISGIIGVGSELKRKAYSCKLCDKGDCIYRRKA